jgi:tRNA U34 5-methylaminomethyl-2-thiouridine-forming methyltransferase MnmC
MTEELNRGPKVELKVTGDGSHTLFVPELGEHYHSVYGAIAESRHIFLKAGFGYIHNRLENIKILEIGFGTGLNALLTYIEAINSGGNVEYTTIELNPLDEPIYSNLNFFDFIDYPGSREIFLHMHQSPWNEALKISSSFHLRKIKISLHDYLPDEEIFDLVYFDAFGPDVQPEMWTLEVFEKMAVCLKKEAILVTYSTKGTVKRNLASAGFRIEKLPGPQGKREILRAFKI